MATRSLFRILSQRIKPISQPSNVIGTCRNKSSWHVVAALCLERKPVVSQEMNSLEKAYWEMLKKMEVEGSLLSDHELRHKEDLERAEKIKKDDADLAEIEKATKLTAQDEEDAFLEELNKFVPASRETDDNKMSVNRLLDQSLVLVVKEKMGQNSHWILPQAINKEGESLRQTTERVFKENFGASMTVKFMGNAPVGYYKYKYPKSARKDDDIFGAKVFFYKAQHEKGYVEMEKQENDKFMWLTKGELHKYLQKEYCKAVENILLDDQITNNLELKETRSAEILAKVIRKSN